MKSNIRYFASNLSGNWIISVFLILSAILFYSRIVKSESIKLKLLPSKQGICNNKTLPEGLSHLDPVLNKLVFCSDKYIGLEVWNKTGSQGFQLYDKNLSLLWDLKPLTFEELKKKKISSDDELRFNDVEITPNAEVIILKLGGRGDLGGHIGIEIYRKTIFGYKKTKTINFSSSECPLAIDEESGFIYTAGFFPNRKESNELKSKCFTSDGGQVWEHTIPDADSVREINVSSDHIAQFLCHVRRFGNGMVLFDSYGKLICNVFERGSCALGLSQNGKVALFAGDNKIHVYDIQPFSERFVIELESNPDWEVFFIKDVAISPDNEKIAVLCHIRSSAGIESRIFLFDKMGIKLAEEGTMKWGINPQKLEFENNQTIRLDKDWLVSIEN